MTLLTVFLLALVLIGSGMLAMAIGVICRRPCLRGSCGGPEAANVKGERLSCATCPNRGRNSRVEGDYRGLVE
jgi:hypothetical protein